MEKPTQSRGVTSDLIKTKWKGYTLSDSDRLAYLYVLFNNYQQIQEKCEHVHLLNTMDGHIGFYRTASHVALLCIKKQIGSAAEGLGGL